jgi:peptide/nickel transport system substrate-binding protein
VRRRTLASPAASLVAALVLLGACGDGGGKAAQPSAPGAERPEAVARIRLAGADYGYPSPFMYLLGPGLVNVNMQFDTLLWKDSTGKPIPWLAKEWARSADGREWRFTLHEGVKWHDGEPFTSTPGRGC